MKTLILSLLLVCSLFAEGMKKIVVDLTVGDIENLEKRLLKGLPGLINNFKKEGDQVDTVVVIHGGSYKFFVENLDNTSYWSDEALVNKQESIHQGLKNLQELGVKFEVCKVGMQRNNILSEDLYPFVKPIRSSMDGLVIWQNKGYAYLPIH